MLGPLLFLLYIDDIDDDLKSVLLKFADDTKIFREVNSLEDKEYLQNDLNMLQKWADRWLMEFNLKKCKTLHLGSKNKDYVYELGGSPIQSTGSEVDLGIVVDKSLKVGNQCAIAAKKGNAMLGMIKRNFNNKDKDSIVRLYKMIVRPHLEYAVQAWNPYLAKDISLLEGVQRRATRMISSFKGLDYRERLKRAGLTTLETRRLRGDMIEVYKIMTGKEGLDKDLFFKRAGRISRGHKYKLEKFGSRLDIRKYCFSNRIVDAWNNLPDQVVSSESLNKFKNALDEHFKAIGKI